MKKIFYLFIAAIAFTAVSCDKDFEEINISPNSSPVTDPNLLLATTIINTQNVIYNAQIGGDMGLCWAQHWSKVQYNDEERYIPRRGNMNALWSSMYASVIAEASSAYELAGDQGNTNLQGAALVMKANALQILTDVYGPVPFSEMGVEGNIKPVHDSQEAVYDGILAMLDEANTLLTGGSGEITATADLLYGGDVAKWKKFGNSLKLKALMRIVKKKPAVASQIQALVTAGNLMASNADSAQLMYMASQPDANPIYETIVNGNRAEYKVSSVLISGNYNPTSNPQGFVGLVASNDPRLAIYAKKNNANAYVGNVPGVENPGNYNGFSSPGTKYLDATLPGVLLSYAQVQLYLAEAANEGYITGGVTTAEANYFKGIKANLEFNGVSTAAANTYVAQVNLGFATQAGGRAKIGTQMWLALYGQGIEAWTEWRRTGVPALAPVANADGTVIPRRFYFSTDSQNYNQVNYTAAAATLDNGDTMVSKVWWMN